MKLRELIHRLEELEEDLHDELGDNTEIEVVAAYQEGYALSGEIKGACFLQEDEDDRPILANGRPVVWIAIGSHPRSLSPYAPAAVFTEAE